MTKEQKLVYDVSWKRYNDYHNTMDYAKQSGLEKGIEIGKKQGIEQGIEQGREEGREEGIEQGREEGIEQGREEGIEKGKIQTAKRLKELKVPIQTIAEATNLSVQKIIKL